MDYDSYIKEGDYIFTSNKKILLTKKIASGGEGRIYETDSQYICKIYKPERVNREKYEKIKLMMNMSIKEEGICWPLEMVYNNKEEFVGFLMNRAWGKVMKKSIFSREALLENFPSWRKRDLVELALTILEKIQYLHDRNIILGDINTKNILVVSQKEVYFVDTDSYQLDGYPCPVGTILFTAPEIQRTRYSTYLRSFGNEYFAVATLLFMIVMVGKTPYASKGNWVLMENIIKRNFIFSLGKSKQYNYGEIKWHYMWSHLPYYLRKDFYKTFSLGGEYSLEDRRISTEEWYDKFKYYLEVLDNGIMGKEDNMSEDIFPTRFRRER